MKTIEVFTDFLRDQHLSITAERLEIVRTAVQFGDRVFSVEDVHLRMKKQRFMMAKSTVYRNIKLLRSAGIVESIPDGIDGRAAFQNLDQQEISCKISCLSCGTKNNLKNEKLEELILAICAEYGVEKHGVVVRIEGRSRCSHHQKWNRQHQLA